MTRTLTSAQDAAIREVRRKVVAMLDERQSGVPEGSAAEPSRYWTDFCSFFDYLIDLSPQSFAKLRLHTYHLTGDNYQTYYFGDRSAFLDYWSPWLSTEGLPAAHILSEPDDGIGFRLDDGRFVSQDIARFQRSVSTLSKAGLLAPRGRPARVVEIGGGYGGLALSLSTILGDSRYVIVDLPEVLLFSAAYLTLHAPEKSLFLYDPASPARLAEADFVLLPDYRLDLLAGSDFDLAINLASMQEMRPEQVERYLDFLNATCSGVFYSCNRDHQKGNDELPGLFSLIRTRFAMTEAPGLSRPRGSIGTRVRVGLRAAMRRGAGALGLVEGTARGTGDDPHPFVEHLCRRLPS